VNVLEKLPVFIRYSGNGLGRPFAASLWQGKKVVLNRGHDRYCHTFTVH
jgi:hypothetical protein